MDLAYNIAFHVRSEVTFAAGQRAILHALHQSLSDGGWLEGRPWREWNDKIIAGSLRTAERYCTDGAQPALITPERRPFLRNFSENDPGRELRRHEPEWLPAVTCIGIFRGSPARDPSKDLGVLTVVWFQDEYAPPITEPVAEQFGHLDWVRLATDAEI